MAGAARRSRAGSIAGTRRHQTQNNLPLSHTTPTDQAQVQAHSHGHGHGRPHAEASAAAVAVAAKTGSDNADEGASPLGSPMNRSTIAYCRQCNTTIGDFYNSWHKVTGSYFIPALPASYTHQLQKTGKVKAASKGNDVAGW